MYYAVSVYKPKDKGTTISILVTQAEATPYQKNLTPKEIVKHQFIDHFGGYMTYDMKILDKEDFVAQYSEYIPEVVQYKIDTLGESDEFSFSQQIYIGMP